MNDDEPRFGAYQLSFFSEEATLELEDDLPEGTVIEAMRELSSRLSQLADYYEAVGTAELFSEAEGDEDEDEDDENDAETGGSSDIN
jgi:hypothetical protein